MVGLFRQKNTANVLWLVLYAFALKLPILLHPAAPLQLPTDHFLYTGLLSFFSGMGLSTWVYTWLSFFLLYFQATLFNRICNLQKLFNRPNFLPAMSFLLLTSLFPTWNQFSALLLVNSMLIWLVFQIMHLYNKHNANAAIFNIGMLFGVVTLFYKPAILLILLLLIALVVMRSFKIREWLLGILGMATPYYFLTFYLLMSDQFSLHAIFPALSFGLPVFPTDWPTRAILLSVFMLFLLGGYYIQDNHNKMLIQVRKNWSMLLFFALVGILITSVSAFPVVQTLYIAVLPLSLFVAAVYYYPSSRTLTLLLHWLMFGAAVFLNYRA